MKLAKEEQHHVLLCLCVRLLRVSLFDYQAMCKMNLHSVSSARPLLSVSAEYTLRMQYYDPTVQSIPQ